MLFSRKHTDNGQSYKINQRKHTYLLLLAMLYLDEEASEKKLSNRSDTRTKQEKMYTATLHAWITDLSQTYKYTTF